MHNTIDSKFTILFIQERSASLTKKTFCFQHGFLGFSTNKEKRENCYQL